MWQRPFIPIPSWSLVPVPNASPLSYLLTRKPTVTIGIRRFVARRFIGVTLQTRTFVALNADHPTVLVNEENIVTHLVSIGFPRKLSFQPGVEAFIGSVSFDAKDEV